MIKVQAIKPCTGRRGWDFMCNVHRVEIIVDHREGHLYLRDGNVPDMRSTITNFLSADPEITRIVTYLDEVPDVQYLLEGDEWVARY